MNNQEFKLTLINKLMNRDIFTQRVSDCEIRTRCPYCGDSQKNFNTGHFYLRINPNDNNAIVYNCFKCPAQGILKYSDLELLGITENEYKENLTSLNKSSDKFSYTDSVEEKYFNYKIPETNSILKIKYIENRLGLNFSDEDIKNMKIITSLKDFLILNKLELNCKPNIAKMVENQYVGFLSSNNAYILFRDITNTNSIRWYKYPISVASYGQKIFYSLPSELDIFTKEKININLSEGILDCISIGYNLDNIKENTLNMCVCGNYYITILRYLISLGLIGENIIINIYSDRDGIEATSLNRHKKLLENYKNIFGEINVYYNLKSKDCGVKKEEILLQKNKL